MRIDLKWVTERIGGRTTAFLGAFFVWGHVLQWYHRLDASYVTFVTVMMGYVLGRSYKEDLHKQKMDRKGDDAEKSS